MRFAFSWFASLVLLKAISASASTITNSWLLFPSIFIVVGAQISWACDMVFFCPFCQVYECFDAFCQECVIAFQSCFHHFTKHRFFRLSCSANEGIDLLARFFVNHQGDKAAHNRTIIARHCLCATASLCTCVWR